MDSTGSTPHPEDEQSFNVEEDTTPTAPRVRRAGPTLPPMLPDDTQPTAPMMAESDSQGAPDGTSPQERLGVEPPAQTLPQVGARGDVYNDQPMAVSVRNGANGYGVPAPISRSKPPESLTVRSRRRRRYTLYLRRSARARAAARASSFGRLTWISLMLMVFLLVSSLAATLAIAATYYQSQEAVILGLGRTVNSKGSVRIYSNDGTLLYQLNSNGAQHNISLAQVPIDVVNATISAEDRTFWTNYGVDPTSIVRAAQENILHKQITQGASTITQQLIKQNILGGSVTYDRKLKEIILSTGLTITGVYTKRQIMELYLNSIPYGPTVYGIDAAAQFYFDYTDNPATGETAAQHLDLAQASLLAGIPQNPNLNEPINHFSTAFARQAYVLQGMVTLGFITQKQADAASAETWNAYKHHTLLHLQPTTPKLAPHFVDFVIQQLQAMVNAHQLNVADIARTGLNVYTTLDLNLENYTEAAMKKHLYGTDHDDYGNYIVNDHVTNTAGMLVQQSTGAILVMQGSVDYYSTQINGQFNVVTQGYRGTGSSFKPIAYATAFEKGWFPAMTIADTPSIFYDAGSGSEYKPLDFDRLFPGEMTLRQALQTSRNIPAVKVMQYAGIDSVERNAIRMGLWQHGWKGTWGLSSVLGSLNVTLYDMVQMYTVLANYGQYIPLHAINEITDSSNNVIYQYHVPQGVQILSPQVAFLVTNILEDNKARAREFGACSPLYLDPYLSPDDPGYIHAGAGTEGPIGNAECAALEANNDSSPNAWPAAVKTGTNNLTDDWTIGYTMDYTMGVWAGNNDYSNFADPSQVGHGIDGITGAAPTWYRTMIYAERNLPKRDFPAPTGVYRATWSSNGITSTDWFIKGMQPPDGTGSGGTNIHVCLTPDGNSWNYCAAPTTPTTPNPRHRGHGGQGAITPWAPATLAMRTLPIAPIRLPQAYIRQRE